MIDGMLHMDNIIITKNEMNNHGDEGWDEVRSMNHRMIHTTNVLCGGHEPRVRSNRV